MPDDIKLTKVPPQSLENEQAVLGSMILDRDQIAIVIEILQADDFYSDKHGLIYKSIIEIYEHNDPVDMVTLIEMLDRKGILEKVGGPAYLTTLVEGVPTPKSAQTYAKIVEEKSMLRSLIKAGNEIVNRGYNSEGEVDEIVSESEKLLYDISRGRAFKDISQIQPVLKQAFDQINQKYKDRGVVSGLGTGYSALNDLTSGFQNSDLIILAARPGMGKTSLALNFCEHIAVEQNIGVGIFSLEMSSTQLATRLLCSRSQVDASSLRKGFLVPDDWPRLTEAFDVFSKAPIVIVDHPNISPLELRAKARRMYKEFGVRMLFIDYLQLISVSGRRPDSRVQEISEITRQLKMLARELDIPVLAISQLSREVEKRPDKRPQLSDLRDSGSIEQDADLVMFLYRDEYYADKKSENSSDDDDERQVEVSKEAELKVAKHRHGPTGKISLVFLNQYTKFVESTEREPYS
ncbi:MAG: replicative DNA helicase [bacterium]